eukprot:TRINITY_DN24311_c0_g2_i1.p1 TRINITY_DN24311_c0_g2~~TRINITY_DN24311_c0_g2_i1.p1  ORF type:complete len:562 (+),score=117.23 TRINITY_DN24311_c0_g2_i1:108-1688(+)
MAAQLPEVPDRTHPGGEPNLWARLGLPHGADRKLIRRAFKALSLRLHPDKNPAELKAEAQRRFTLVSAAWEVLQDEDRRGAYLRRCPPPQPQRPPPRRAYSPPPASATRSSISPLRSMSPERSPPRQRSPPRPPPPRTKDGLFADEPGAIRCTGGFVKLLRGKSCGTVLRAVAELPAGVGWQLEGRRKVVLVVTHGRDWVWAVRPSNRKYRTPEEEKKLQAEAAQELRAERERNASVLERLRRQTKERQKRKAEEEARGAPQKQRRGGAAAAQPAGMPEAAAGAALRAVVLAEGLVTLFREARIQLACAHTQAAGREGHITRVSEGGKRVALRIGPCQHVLWFPLEALRAPDGGRLDPDELRAALEVEQRSQPPPSRAPQPQSPAQAPRQRRSGSGSGGQPAPQAAAAGSAAAFFASPSDLARQPAPTSPAPRKKAKRARGGRVRERPNAELRRAAAAGGKRAARARVMAAVGAVEDESSDDSSSSSSSSSSSDIGSGSTSSTSSSSSTSELKFWEAPPVVRELES